MKKGLSVSLFLLTGLFTWNVTAFASENVIQIIEAQHDKSALFIRLFISLVALVLYIGICRTALLFLHYKEIFGAKDALARILFNSRSLATTNVRNLKQSAFLQQYKKALAEKTGQGNAFGLDTNILMHYPAETFEILKNEAIVLSREVQKELDGLKNSTDKETSANARRAFKAIEDAQRQGQTLTILPSVDYKTITQLKLTDTMDDRILAAYLQLHKQGKAIYFLTNDRGAKITARNAGMPIVEIEPSAKQGKKSGTGIMITGVIGFILLVGLVGYNAFSFFQANQAVKQHIYNTGSPSFDKGTEMTNNYAEIIERINEDPEHIYFPENAEQFIEPTKEGRAIYQSLQALEWTERKPLTDQLREILKPLTDKYYPQIDLVQLSDETIQTIFFFGQSDLRFGLAVLNWRVDVSNDSALIELLAIDASDIGFKVFESNSTLDEVKFELIPLLNRGPFEE